MQLNFILHGVHTVSTEERRPQPITLRDFGPNLEKYKVVPIFFLCRKMEIRRIATILIILFLGLKILRVSKVRSWSACITNV